MLTKRYQTDCAMPMPRLTGPVSGPPACRLLQLVRSRISCRSTLRAGFSSIFSRRASGSMLSLTASSSMACSNAKHPCGWPGARNAAPGPALMKTSYSSVSRFGHLYILVAGPAVPAPVPTPAVP